MNWAEKRVCNQNIYYEDQLLLFVFPRRYILRKINNLHLSKLIVLFQLYRSLIVALQTADVDLTSQISEVNNRVTAVNSTVNDLDDRVSVLETNGIEIK